MIVCRGEDYVLRNGDEYRMLADDAGGNYPIVGLARNKGSDTWYIVRHSDEGVSHITGKPGEYDLVYPPAVRNRDVWLNLYKDGTTGAWNSEAAAIRCGGQGLEARARVTVVYREGDGL
jgi:hypothetical protein